MRNSTGKSVIQTIGFTGIVLFLWIGVLGCATVPDYTQKDVLSYLPQGYPLYARIDPQKHPELLEQFTGENFSNQNNIKIIADKTEMLYLASSPQSLKTPGNKKNLGLSGIALGDFPAFTTGIGLCFNKQWKKEKGDYGAYWQHTESNIQLAFRRGLLLFSSGNIITMLSSIDKPDSTVPFSGIWLKYKNTSMQIYINMQTKENMITNQNIPIHELVLALTKESEDTSRIDGTITAADETKAAYLSAMFKFILISYITQYTESDRSEIVGNINITKQDNMVLFENMILKNKAIQNILEKNKPQSGD